VDATQVPLHAMSCRAIILNCLAHRNAWSPSGDPTCGWLQSRALAGSNSAERTASWMYLAAHNKAVLPVMVSSTWYLCFAAQAVLSVEATHQTVRAIAAVITMPVNRPTTCALLYTLTIQLVVPPRSPGDVWSATGLHHLAYQLAITCWQGLYAP
jgi:hypothetical protein